MAAFEDTICAPATAVGTGVISVIRVSGKNALAIADTVIRLKSGCLSDLEGYSLKYGEIPGVDDVLVSVFRSPHSYTGEDGVEISCHASAFIVSRILELLTLAGARIAEPGEFTRRAFVNGKMDLAQAEAVADLIASSSEASHRLAMSQLKGGISRELSDLRDKLLELTSLLELELDFSEEDVEFASRSQLTSLLETVIAKVSSLAGSFRIGNAIRNGVPVVIAGPVNAGKSTLLNALLGEDRAIVSSEEGTTRDTVEEVMTIGGIQFRFIDTAGLRSAKGLVERMGIERSFQKISQAQIVICLLDATATLDEDVAVLRKILPAVDPSVQKLLVVRNKVDLFDAIDPENFSTVDRSYGLFELKYPAFGTYLLSPDALREKIAEKVEGAGGFDAGAGRRASGSRDCRSGGFDASIGEGGGADGFDAGVGEGVGADEAGCGKDGGVLEGATFIDISAQTGEGISELTEALCNGLAVPEEDVLVSNARHYEALLRAETALTAVRGGIADGLTGDLLAEDLREALRALGSITGADITPDEVLGSIFGRFCIGK